MMVIMDKLHLINRKNLTRALKPFLKMSNWLNYNLDSSQQQNTQIPPFAMRPPTSPSVRPRHPARFTAFDQPNQVHLPQDQLSLKPPPTLHQQVQEQSNFLWVNQKVKDSKSRISRPLKKLLISRNLDNIEILGQVGEGTYGKVFKAFLKSCKTIVALKKMVLKEEEKGKDKHKDGFPITSIREIRILRKLSHPNIVELLSMVLIPSKKLSI